MKNKNSQRKLLFDNEAKTEPASPFVKDRKRALKKSLKELPIGYDVSIEVSTHRQPLKGELILLDDPLLLSDSKSNPRFKVQGNEFTKRDILGWCRLD